jgi:hypothetical protein
MTASCPWLTAPHLWLLQLAFTLPYKPSAWTTQKARPLLLKHVYRTIAWQRSRRGLHRKLSIVEACLPNRCLAIAVTVTILRDSFNKSGHFVFKLLISLTAVAKLVEALCYKPEGRGFECRWGGFFFNLPNSSSSTMALGSTQPLTKMSTRNTPGVKGRPARKADNLTAICEPIV